MEGEYLSSSNTTEWRVVVDPSEGQGPSQKHGLALAIPIFVGILVFSALITAAVFYCSYKQEQQSPNHVTSKQLWFYRMLYDGIRKSHLTYHSLFVVTERKPKATTADLSETHESEKESSSALNLGENVA